MRVALLVRAFAAALALAAAPAHAAEHGDLISSQPFPTGAAALPSAASNSLIRYHTVAVDGQTVEVTGIVSLPRGTPPPSGWPAISWAHGTTGNAPQCTPSRLTQTDPELQFLDSLVKRGYAVLHTDYEGQGTTNLHPYFVAKAYAHDVSDIVRAARHLDSRIGSRWVVMGHSEGGGAALDTAEYAQAWTPEIALEGVVAYAPGSHITYSLQNTAKATIPTRTLPFMAMMAQGIGLSDPEIHLDKVFTPLGMAMLPQLQKRCIGELMRDEAWTTIPPSSLFAQGPELHALLRDFYANEPGISPIATPILLVQGEDDTLVPPQSSMDLVGMLESMGDKVTYIGVPGANHGTVMEASLDRVAPWLEQRFR